MNLYIFNETRRGTVFGVGTYIRELTAALKDSGINICVINLISDKPQIQTEEIDGIKHWDFPLPLQWTRSSEEHWDLYHKNIVYLLQLHIEDKNNLIFHLNFNQKSGLAEELKKAFDCRIVLTIHYLDWCFSLSGNLTRFRHLLKAQQTTQGDNVEELKEAFQKEKKIFKVADRIICLSGNTRQLLQEDYKVKPEKVTVLYNGLTDNNTITEKTALRQKYFIPDIPIILFVGRLDDIKGLLYALRAFRIVLRTHPNCRFIISGNGAFDTYMAACEDIWMNVTWTGLINKEKLYELYTIADIGVIPSFHEQCSYVAIEMMMHGLPIIGSTTTGLKEMIVNGETGLHIPVIEYRDRTEIDSSLLAEKMLYLLQHPTEARQMGKNGRKRYLENYSLDIFRENMLQMYKSVCQHRKDNKIKTLIVTGQNNHKWEVSHVAIEQILENSGLFSVDIAISPKAGEYMFNFKPDFASYQLVVLDYNGDRWPEETEKSFFNFVEKGGGVVVYHAANNAFRHWKEYNRIIGFGGWENRNETDGPYIYIKNGKLTYDEESTGCGGSHGYQHEFILNCDNPPDHPITKGLPAMWRHAQDELYDRMRGPGIVKDVLFWAYSDPETKGSDRDEIAIFTVDYGKARIFHTTLGHAGNTLDSNIAMQCTGFQVTLLRGAEWAATGRVEQQVPSDFPTATTISLRKNYK
jgi:glycosyltransferase